MTIDAQHGSPQFPTVAGDITASTPETMREAVRTLQTQKDAWVSVSLRQRLAMVEQLIKDFATVMPRWIAASCAAKGVDEASPAAGDEWAAGAWPLLKYLRQFRQSLLDIEAYGQPRIPGPVTTRPSGQVVAQVFPQNFSDSIFGLRAEVWMDPAVSIEQLAQTQALAYRDKQHAGKVALVLGAGNVSSIGPLDILYKMFVDDQVVLFKANPVNAYLGPLLEESFRALVEPGYLRIVYGGATEGSYLCHHPDIDEIHITGSDKTFDAIVFGTGAEGAARKAAHQPLLKKPITGELGNVSPVIVVPGPWSAGDIAYQAAHIASMLTNNAGFNCNATRIIIQHAEWPQREQLVQQISRVLANVPSRDAYYPGAQQRQQSFIAAHPDAEQFGAASGKHMPWTFVTHVDAANSEDICFTTEAFCGLFAETALSAEGVVDYIERAVSLANEQLWGTLSATILVHPQSLKDPAVAAAVERALDNLRYGTIGVNYWAGSSFSLGATTWGAFPGHEISDIQSGTGVVHNSLLFAQAQKSVVRGAFRSIPTPPWFVTRGTAERNVFAKLAAIEAEPAFWKLPGVIWSALGG